MFTGRLANLTGAGIRVGLVDSGCDNSHPALRQITRGRDFTGQRNANGWTDDSLGYGTHGAGLLVAAAPEAELHAYKVCPGGRLSDLLAALDECIARELDLVCLSVTCEEPSELLDQKLRELRHKGIACIAAGASGATLQFAAAPAPMLAVGAVGKLGEFPPDTCHALTAMPGLIGGDGVFAAAFTGAGSHIALSAPGVAVVSSVPGGQAALDGTGVAAAGVTSLAALIIAHHPLFQGPLRPRNEQRVAGLVSLLQAAAVPYVADPQRGGAGVPELRRVPGLFGGVDMPVQMPLAGSEVFPFAGGLFAPGWHTLAQGWHTLAQMRASGRF
jgi:subtilisin family serine protease